VAALVGVALTGVGARGGALVRAGEGTARATHRAGQLDVDRAGQLFHHAGVGDNVAGRDLVRAHRSLRVGGGGHRGGHRVLLHVVVARRDVDADVARRVVERVVLERRAVGHALVDRGVAGAVLVDEDLG